MQPYFFEWMLNESNLFLNLFYYLLTRGYWLPKSQGGNLSVEVALHVQGWKLKKYMRDAWGERLSQGCSFIQECCDPEHCGESRADRVILGRSVGGWGVPWEAHTKSGFEAPTAQIRGMCHFRHWSLLEILLQSVEGVTQSMSYFRTHWWNVFIFISESAAEGEGFF